MTNVSQTVTVERLAQSGEGVVRLEGQTFGVPGTLPGEVLRVQRAGAALHLLSVESASPARVPAVCPVVERCGGCVWQHASAEAQGEARLAVLRRALPPALRALPIAYTPSAERYGWRTRARLAWRVLRAGGVVLGYRARSQRDVVDVPGCPVLDARLEAALAPLRAHLGALGAAGEVSIALSADGRPVASLHPLGELSAEGYRVPEALVAAGFAGAALWPTGVTTAVTAGDARPTVAGPDGVPLGLGVDGFAQAHAALNPALAAAAAARCGAEGRSVLELHAGAGNFTVLLARVARRVVAVETHPGSVAALRDNLEARGLTAKVTVRAESAEDAVRRGVKADVVLLDPPRSGAREVCELLARTTVRRVVYVSCDASTLGRDLSVLGASYSVTSLEAFEMFPHTPHVETVVTLQARRGSA